MTVNINDFAVQLIPEISSVAGWKEVPLTPGDEPLVPLGLFSNYKVFTSSIYYGEHQNSPYTKLPGSLITLFARRSVAEQIMEAEALLPVDYHLVVFDAYRPLQVQQALYDEYYTALKAKQLKWSDEALAAETQKYVSLPSNNPDRPSPHNTGGAVDLAIMKLPEAISKRLRNAAALTDVSAVIQLENDILAYARMLDFGTAFDWGQSEAALRYLEEESTDGKLGGRTEALQNRRKLYHLMRQVGLEAYADEWWHFNSVKSQMGVKTAGAGVAEFGAALPSDDNIAHELHRQKLAGSISRETSLPMAAIIKPAAD